MNMRSFTSSTSDFIDILDKYRSQGFTLKPQSFPVGYLQEWTFKLHNRLTRVSFWTKSMGSTMSKMD